MAAVDGIVTAHSSVNAAASLSIQASSGEEWLIRNIWYGAAVEIYRTDGTNTVKIHTDTGAGCLPVSMGITSGVYLSVKNTSAGAAYFGYDGYRTV